MNKSTLGLLAVVVIVVGGGAGCIVKQNSQTPPVSPQEQAAAPAAPSEVAPSPAPTMPDPSAREASAPSVSEIVVTKMQDKAGSVTPPAPTPTPADSAKTGTAVVYQASVNSSPSANLKFTPEDAMKPIIFKWTPIVPKPQSPVVYRLKVWQLMQGQSSSSAMRTNQPIVTKDVDNITQASVSGIYTGPCRPPYLCDFVWSVSAMSGGADVGMSEATMFSVTAPTTSSPTDTGSAADTGATGVK